MGWEITDVFEVLEDTIDASFAPEVEKDRLRQVLKRFIANPECHLDPNFNDRVHFYD